MNTVAVYLGHILLSHEMKYNMMLSYRRQTALQSALVLAKSGRLNLGKQYFTGIIGLPSTTVT